MHGKGAEENEDKSFDETETAEYLEQEVYSWLASIAKVAFRRRVLDQVRCDDQGLVPVNIVTYRQRQRGS